MADTDSEEQAPETPAKSGGIVQTAISGVGIFVVVLAAQIAAPPITQMIYGGAEDGLEAPMEGDEALTGEEGIDFAALDPAIYTPLDPPLVVSLIDSTGESRYLQLSVQAMARNQEVIDEIRVHAPALRNSFLFLISTRSYDDLATVEGKEQLRADMLTEAQTIMEENTGAPGLEELYFTSLVVQ